MKAAIDKNALILVPVGKVDCSKKVPSGAVHLGNAASIEGTDLEEYVSMVHRKAESGSAIKDRAVQKDVYDSFDALLALPRHRETKRGRYGISHNSQRNQGEPSPLWHI